MSIKNFKISTGLDLEGLVLTNGGDGELHLDGAALATQQYVIDAIAGVDVDLSDNAGAYLDWNAGTSQFDLNISDVATDLAATHNIATQTYADTAATNAIDNALITPAGAIIAAITGQGFAYAADIPSLAGYATETYVTTALNDYTPTASLDALIGTAPGGYGYLKSADLPTMYTDADAITAIANSVGPGLMASPTVGNSIEIKYGTGLTIGDAAWNAGQLLVDYGYGLTVGVNAGTTNQIVVDTDVIATKAYADSIASGLDIKASVHVASTTNIDLSTFDYTGAGGQIDGVNLNAGERVLLKDQTDLSENGIYVADTASTALVRAADAIPGTTLSKGSFTFVEQGTNAGHGFVVSTIEPTPTQSIIWTQFSDSGNYITSVDTNLSVTNGLLSVDLSSKQNAFTVGNGLQFATATELSVDLNAIAGTGITVNGNQLEAAPAYITSVDASFAVTNGELSLSDNITIASVELTDSVANVTAASDVFGDASTSAYAMGSAVTIGTLPTGAEVADVFVTLKSVVAGTTTSRTSKLTYVNTGGDAPTWTEYGIIVSGAFPSTTVGFDSSGNITANVTGSDTYSVKGVVTILK